MRNVLVISALAVLCLLSACAKTDLEAPCPNFGARCHQMAINAWDLNQ